MKLSCQDMGVSECDHEVEGQTKEEVAKKMMAHAMDAHPDKIKEMKATMSEDEIMEEMKSKIKE